MKGMMLNEHVGLETATLKGEKERTSRKEKFCKQAEQDIKLGYTKLMYINDEIHLFNKEETAAVSYKQRYKINEIVAIKQSYKTVWENIPNGPEKDAFKKRYENTSGWTNKMFAKNEVMPHQVLITNIKLQNLQSISNEDCIKEGIHKHVSHNKLFYKFYNTDWYFDTPLDAFHAIIDYLCGKAWADNDLYVVYYYKLLK